ncbi:MAG TPA: phage protease [Anaerohalosphaeraceae bacterium]|nr:phage protease [Anaerohalosphaeraceae bacterium]HRT24500.1 phage protease [Anaerohalosphaeraceae bacterium]
MPYPNEHAARINNPDKYVRIRRENDKFEKGIHVLWGVLPDGTVEVQAIRFDAGKFTPEEAKRWLKEHDYKKFQFEKASGKEEISASMYYARCPNESIAISAMSLQDNVPVRKFRKELIKTGTYINKFNGKPFEITRDTLKHWECTFQQWRDNGLKVPVPLTHKGADDPSKNQGWVVDMFADGDSLVGILELVGEDAEKLAKTSDVSIFSPEEAMDSKGNYYIRPITHVALCTNPAIPGLENFKLVASLEPIELNQENKSMKEIAKLLGLAEDASEEQILAALAELLKKVQETKETPVEAAAKEEQKKNAISMSAPEPVMPDPVLVRLASENREMKLNTLVAAGRITPAVKEKLAKRYVETGALQLSMSKGDDGFDELVKILAENDPVILKEHTSAQTLELSGGPTRTNYNPLIADAERRAAEASKR